MMITTGEAGGPGVGLAVGTGVEILGIEVVEAGTGQAQLSGGGTGADLASAMTVEQLTNEWSGVTLDQL
jgi:hypothetical protein